MDNFEFEIDNKAVESTVNQIHYYSNLPKHIKGMATELNSTKLHPNSENPQPAHVIEGTLTVKMGKMNIPVVNYSNQFLNKTVSSFTNS